MKISFTRLCVALFASLSLTGMLTSCSTNRTENSPTLKGAFRHDFLIGVAVNQKQFTEEDTNGAALIKAQFNAITPENVLKWESVHPQPGKYDFSGPDKYVEFGEKNNLYIVGHTLVWHSQTPKWVFEDGKGKPLTRDALLQRMHDHIATVVGRYKGRIKAWDVVNEAFNKDGSWRDTPWHKIIGDDFIAKAFEYAHEADPQAELNYNEFDLEKPAKRDAVIAELQKLKSQGVPITGIGSQTHVKLDSPSAAQEDATLTALSKLHLKVMITELDVSVLPRDDSFTNSLTDRLSITNYSAPQQMKLNPYTSGLPKSIQRKLAQRYAELFGIFLKHRDVIKRVTLWNLTDGDSWLNTFPVDGRTDYPVLFDRQWQPKPAFEAVIQAAHSTR